MKHDAFFDDDGGQPVRWAAWLLVFGPDRVDAAKAVARGFCERSGEG